MLPFRVFVFAFLNSSRNANAKHANANFENVAFLCFRFRVSELEQERKRETRKRELRNSGFLADPWRAGWLAGGRSNRRPDRSRWSWMKVLDEIPMYQLLIG